MSDWTDWTSWTLLAQAAPDGGGNFLAPLGPWLPLVVIGILFYLMLIRPERRKAREADLMRENVKKNDKVVTIGGILGTVVNVQKGSDEITLKVDDNTRIRFLRSAISRVLTAESEGDKKTTE